MELFVMAHEYGHLIENHGFEVSRQRLLQEAGAEIAKWTWFQESEADSIGLNLTIAAADMAGVPHRYPIASADLMLTSLSILDQIDQLRHHGHQASQYGRL
jgi:hypothetical protein